MGILVVGTAITSTFSFEALSNALSHELGEWAAVFFAAGLFAAGFSSAVTAPLAAAITAQGLFDSADNKRWHERSWRYRGVWLVVLATGVFFGVIGVRPVPAIIIAQALNGILLPFVATFLFLVVNDRLLMGERGINGLLSNVLMGIVVAVTIVLGVSKVGSAVTSAAGLPALGERLLLVASAAIAVLIAACLARTVLRRRR
jgi:Mn2+/Fe2+ NRAMP family transporter